MSSETSLQVQKRRNTGVKRLYAVEMSNFLHKNIGVRGDLRDVERNIFNYSVATGMFFTDDEAYVVEIYESGKTDEFSVVLT